MGVSPVDMQVMIPKTVDVARQQSSDMHKINADQQNIVQKETQKQEDNTKKVHDRDSTEKIYVDDREKEKREKEKEEKKSNNEEEEKTDDEKNVISDTMRGGHFDASV